MRMLLRIPLVITSLLLMAQSDLLALDYAFEPIDITGAESAIAFDINNQGTVVGTYTDEMGSLHGFIYEQGVFSTIDVPDGEDAEAFAINDDGVVVGLYFPLLDDEELDDPFGFLDLSLPSFRYDGVEYTDVVVEGAFATLANGINNAGVIVGSSIDGFFDSSSAFVISNGMQSRFQYPEGADSGASGVNDADEIVGFFFDDNDDARSFLRSSNGEFSIIEVPNALLTSAEAINNGGHVAGYYVDDNDVAHGFVRAGTSFTTVDFPAANETEIYGLNDAGVLVGTYLDDGGSNRAFLARQVTRGDFNSDGMIDVDDFAIQASNFNTAGLFEDGDLDGNFIVELADFREFRQLFAANSESVVAIPEVMGTRAIWLAFLLVARHRFRQRRTLA